jgi:hypothetical protein
MDLRNIIQQEINNLLSGLNKAPISDQIEISEKKNHFGKRPIIQFTLDGDFVREFESIKEANRELGVSEKYVSKHLRGKTKTCKGFIFRYKEI